MINKNFTISQVLNKYPETKEVFEENGMHCLGCPTATRESIEQAAGVHGLDLDGLMTSLNEAIGEK
jgi:hybrid cluster-associated redox disulfide protein